MCNTHCHSPVEAVDFQEYNLRSVKAAVKEAVLNRIVVCKSMRERLEPHCGLSR